MDSISSDVNETLITLTSDIVAAHVSNNSVSVEELAALISNVYSALAGLGKAAPVAEAAPLKPAVSVRASVKPDHITCLDCGMELKMLKRHLSTHHGMSPEDYKARWGLGADYPLVAPNYADKRRDLAVKIGLGRKPGVKRGRKPKA
ncbi:MAG: MucR family transcriptional regulator [Proteobacteria bacterium]|nr:MucR family transcriptional regulator [Pseudomonadota bacterium]